MTYSSTGNDGVGLWCPVAAGHSLHMLFQCGYPAPLTTADLVHLYLMVVWGQRNLCSGKNKSGDHKIIKHAIIEENVKVWVDSLGSSRTYLPTSLLLMIRRILAAHQNT